jgi:hypothetical protein
MADPPAFQAYYDRRYREELAKLCKAPSLSLGFCMVMAHLPVFVMNEAEKEYDKLYPGARAAA